MLQLLPCAAAMLIRLLPCRLIIYVIDYAMSLPPLRCAIDDGVVSPLRFAADMMPYAYALRYVAAY